MWRGRKDRWEERQGVSSKTEPAIVTGLWAIENAETERYQREVRDVPSHRHQSELCPATQLSGHANIDPTANLKGYFNIIALLECLGRCSRSWILDYCMGLTSRALDPIFPKCNLLVSFIRPFLPPKHPVFSDTQNKKLTTLDLLFQPFWRVPQIHYKTLYKCWVVLNVMYELRFMGKIAGLAF